MIFSPEAFEDCKTIPEIELRAAELCISNPRLSEEIQDGLWATAAWAMLTKEYRKVKE